jgi:DNA replication protein DnaC
VPSATAILDRFLQHAEVISITGRSYRLKGKPLDDGKKEK